MAKKNTARRASTPWLEFVTTRDGRRVRNECYDPKHPRAKKTPVTQQSTVVKPLQKKAAAKKDDKKPEKKDKPAGPKLVHHLIAVDSNANANKEYRIYKNPDGTVTAKWGRVGAGKLQQKVYPPGKEEELFRKKTKKGYVEATVIDSDRSDSADVSGADTITRFLNPSNDRVISRMLSDFVSLNAHSIKQVSGGSITVDTSGLARTALGVVDKNAVDQARKIFDKGDKIDTRDGDKYLSLIPQKTRSVQDFVRKLKTDKKFRDEQSDLLRQLDVSADMYEKRKTAAQDNDDNTPVVNPFRYTMRQPDATEKDRISKLIDENIAIGHTNTRRKPKVKNIIMMEDGKPDMEGKSRLAFHGTAPANCLSLSTGGLKGPADLAVSGTKPRYVGSMFSNLERPASRDRESTSGTGVYLAQTKTAGDYSKFGNWGRGGASMSKSLGYTSNGGWLSSSSGSNYVFLVEAYTGNECRSTATGSRMDLVNKFRQDSSKDSIVVKGGDCGVQNDEMVVASSRCRIRAVIEIDK